MSYSFNWSYQTVLKIVADVWGISAAKVEYLLLDCINKHNMPMKKLLLLKNITKNIDITLKRMDRKQM